MAEARLSTRWQMVVEVLSPLHVGAGGPRLLYDYDFVSHKGDVWVIDLNRALDRLPDERVAGLADARLSSLLNRRDYDECARYQIRLRGAETPQEIVPCVRDVYDRPYLPGSSLKGALRTAVAWAWLGREDRPVDLEPLERRREYAAGPLERRLFGPNPNQSLFRGLRVADAAIEGDARPELTIAAVYSLRGGRLVSKGPGYGWHLETLPAGTRLAGTLSLDEHVFGPQARALTFNQHRAWLADLPAHCRAFARELARHEAQFYASAGLPKLAEFYRALAGQAEQASPGEGLVQLGWGTGWTAKTVGLLLGREQLADLVNRYKLDRGRQAGVFPKTRRLVEHGNTPELPLGWVRFRLIEG